MKKKYPFLSASPSYYSHKMYDDTNPMDRRYDSDISVKQVKELQTGDCMIEYYAFHAGRWDARLAAVKKLTDQGLLEKIAKTDIDPRIRIKAINKLTDEEVLREIACTEGNMQVRLAIIAKFPDPAQRQAKIHYIARYDEKEDNRLAAIEKLTDQSVLTDIAKHDQASKVRAAAIKMLTDQSLLADIAKHDKAEYIRAAVVERLTDQHVLADMAKCDESPTVCRSAIARISDPNVLAELAKVGNKSAVRLAVAEKLSDPMLAQKVYADLAKYDRDRNTRGIAIAKLTDQRLLAVIAKNDSDSMNRRKAVTKISDPILEQETVTYLAMNEEVSWRDRLDYALKIEDNVIAQAIIADFIIHHAAEDYFESEVFSKLTDQHLLAGVAKNAPSLRACFVAVSKLTDKNLLTDVAKNSRHDRIRAEVMKQGLDPAALADIATTDADGRVRMGAAEILSDPAFAQEVYAAVAGNEAEDRSAREEAVAKLTVESVLAELAMNPGNGHVRLAAVEKLSDPALRQQGYVALARHDAESEIRIKAADALVNNDPDENLLDELILICGRELKSSDDENIRNQAAATLLTIYRKYGKRKIAYTYNGTFIRTGQEGRSSHEDWVQVWDDFGFGWDENHTDEHTDTRYTYKIYFSTER